MKRSNRFSIPLLLMLALTSTACQSKAGSHLSRMIMPDSSQYRGTITAPEFPKNMQWLNTDRPLSLKELRGKVVLLDFWTYGCINCYHIIPDLEKLEEDFPNTLVIIGVQSAKFASSGEIQNLRQAVLRWGLKHPVVNDKDFKIWNEYAIHAWPTLVLIDPTGKIVGELSGEGIYDTMHQYISGVIKTFDKEGKINRKPLNFSPLSDKVAQSLLYFPGKLLADGEHDRLFISDTDHNRIVITNLDGKVEAVVGNGKAALGDGSYSEASFNQPQGLTLIGDKLYIADTGNNAIRIVDLDKKTVTTLAGNGKQAQQFNKPGFGKKVELNSPWDITHIGDELYVAMAGPHQIWKIDPHTGFSEPFAGTGAEGLQEGKRRDIPMAQPSGITTDGKYLYVAEPEASAVQRIGLGDDKQVTTIVGKGLFVFGDKDGSRKHALLQHDLGIALWNGKLLVADTYNNKIKEIDPETGRTTTFLGNGKSGYKDGTGKEAEFDEPGGLSVAGNWLYIADTDNHLIRKANLKTREVETLQLTNLDKLEMPRESDHPQKIVELPARSIAPGTDQISFTLTIPGDYHFNRQASNQFILSFDQPAAAFSGKKQAVLTLSKTDFPLTIPVDLSGKQPQILFIDVYAYFCRNGNDALCRYTSYRYKIPLNYSENGHHRIQIRQELQIPGMAAVNQ